MPGMRKLLFLMTAFAAASLGSAAEPVESASNSAPGSLAYPDDTFWAGAAKTDITPPSLSPLWGYGSRGKIKSTGTRDPLHARALVLRFGNQAIALISLDLGRPPVSEAMQEIRAKAKELGVSALFVVASHTHHGPVMERDQGQAWPESIAYRDLLVNKLNGILTQAATKCQPCTISMAAEQTNLNRNRHDRAADPPRDGRFTVLKVQSEKGESIARVVHFPAHPVLVPATDLRFSADWAGVMCQKLEEQEGGICLYLQGAEGDLSPNTPTEVTGLDLPKDAPNHERFGWIMAAKAKSLFSQAKKLETGPILGKSEKIRLPVRIDPSNPFVRTTLGRAFYPELVRHYETEYRGGVTTPLEVAILGKNLALVGIAGEPFCAHALRLQSRFGPTPVLTLGCCNDYHQYFPTLEALPKGGYGTEPWISPTVPGTGEYLFNRALVHLYKLTGSIAPTAAPDLGAFQPLPD